MIECEWFSCKNSIKSDKWNKIKAHNAGWYFQRDGTAWCPDHRPEWAPSRD